RDRATRLEGEDRGSDLADGRIEVVDSLAHAGGDLRYLNEADGALEGEPGGEQALDHHGVKVPGDAVAGLEQDRLPHPGVQAGVLDGDAGGHGQSRRRVLVLFGELGGSDLVGQVQVAEDVAADPHGDTEERLHGRVV